MAGKTAAKATTTKKSTSKTTKRGGTASTAIDQGEHERAAYFNWINRGAPVGDDQRDWFETGRC